MLFRRSREGGEEWPENERPRLLRLLRQYFLPNSTKLNSQVGLILQGHVIISFAHNTWNFLAKAQYLRLMSDACFAL